MEVAGLHKGGKSPFSRSDTKYMKLMKRTLLILLSVPMCLMNNCRSMEKEGTVIQLNDSTFKERVFNYEQNTQWKFEGDLPAIVDFYADWCKPCLEMAPDLEDIAREYRGQIVVYKVDISAERTLAENMQVKRLPLLLFIPESGMPKLVMKAIPKELMVETVEEVLLEK
jgi:thiol-disulfide isomerase/thioredoxin